MFGHTKCLLLFLWFITFTVKGQVLITSPTMTYNQDFGTVDVTSWTDNTTYLGWYQSSTFQLHANITAAAPSNNGGFYTYECNSNNNQKIGARPSNGTGTISYGVRFKNTTSSTITTLRLAYDWYQLSLAGNGNAVNTNIVSYIVSNTAITSLTAGTWTDISSFTAPRDTSSTSSGAQHYGFPCTVTGNKEQCFFTIINPGDEIMIRWRDVNNTNNDPHLGIDNVNLYFGDVICGALPIKLIYFDAIKKDDYNRVEWEFDDFVDVSLESGFDGFNFYKIYQTLGTGLYNDYNYYPTTYYRLTYDNEKSKILAIEREENTYKIVKIYNLLGQEVDLTYVGIKFLVWDNGKVTTIY